MSAVSPDTAAQTRRNRSVAGKKAAQAKKLRTRRAKAASPFERLEGEMAGARALQGSAPVVTSIAQILDRAKATVARLKDEGKIA